MKDKIKKLLKEKNAILLAHNYQPPEIQDLANLCGDSLELSIKAAETDAEIIVFCGVHFMAETASILSPEKTVLLPKFDAGCPMAEMINAEALKKKLRQMPKDIPVVTYVNSTAEVKALSTVCCTSANVIKVVNSLDEDEVLMTPDRNLAQYAAANTDKKIHWWDGCCPVHDSLTASDVKGAKFKYPKAELLLHPECPPEALELADAILSTSGMIRHARESEKREFLIGTEIGLLYPLQQANPGKTFYAVSRKIECPDMKKISLEDILKSLENMSGEIKVPEEIRIPALSSVERMIRL